MPSVWEERPPEVANLLNPAFCAILLSEAINGFQTKRELGMPYPLTYLVLPLVLHKPTRDNLPRTTATRLHAWLQKQPEMKIRFAERTGQLVAYTKEALMFGLQVGIIAVNEDGLFIRTPEKLKKSLWGESTEPTNCRKKAVFVGHWLALSGEVTSIFGMWGIRP